MRLVSDILDNISRYLLVFTLSTMAVVVFTQVLFRYLLNFPLFWTEELGRYLLVWSSLLGGAIALKRHEHIAVTFLTDRVPKKFRAVIGKCAMLLIIFQIAILTVGGVELVYLTKLQTSPALRIPMALPYLALPVGGCIMLVHALAHLFDPGQPGGNDGNSSD